MKDKCISFLKICKNERHNIIFFSFVFTFLSVALFTQNVYSLQNSSQAPDLSGNVLSNLDPQTSQSILPNTAPNKLNNLNLTNQTNIPAFDNNSTTSADFQNMINDLLKNYDGSTDPNYYLSYIQQYISQNPQSFDYYKQVINSGTSFSELTKAIHLDSENFTSYMNSILLYPKTECNDGIDDDSDGLFDQYDPGCWDNMNDPRTYDPSLNHENRATIACFQDFQCGINKYFGNLYCLAGDVYINHVSYSCVNKGLGSSVCVKEYQPLLASSCVYGCNNGFCTGNTEQARTNVESNPTSISRNIKLNSIKPEQASPVRIPVDENKPGKISSLLLIQLCFGVILEIILTFLVLKFILRK